MAFAAAVCAALGSSAARAGDPNPFSALVGESRSTTVERDARGSVERYVVASDDRALLLRTGAGVARIQFLCGQRDARVDCALDPEGPAAEIHQLYATRGPRGDVIYKTAEGDPMLRMAAHGGATIFWPGEERGLAALKSFGENASLDLGFMGMETAHRRAQAATAYISAKIGSPIIFEIASPAESDGGNAAVLADAVLRAAKGIAAVAEDPTGARVLGLRLRKVSLVAGGAPALRLTEDALIVTYAPKRDLAGRVSSRGVERYLELHL